MLQQAETGHLLEVRGLTVEFREKRSMLGRRSHAPIRAVHEVDLAVNEGETLGLVGESGSGKSTTGRAILGLVEPTGGSIRYRGIDISRARARELRQIRQNLSIVFQDPYSSLDPSMRIGQSVGEPLIYGPAIYSSSHRIQIATRALQRVGLEAEAADRYPHEFSGGQLQRVAIARAIVGGPELIVCDEAVSSLDVTTQTHIINLLAELQIESSMGYLFIAHDLAVVRSIADRVAVMYLGKIVESGPTNRIFDFPAHPYTVALLSAIPGPGRRRSRERIVLRGEPTVPFGSATGCVFRARCPEAMDICGNETPKPAKLAGGGWAACHLYSST